MEKTIEQEMGAQTVKARKAAQDAKVCMDLLTTVHCHSVHSFQRMTQEFRQILEETAAKEPRADFSLLGHYLLELLARQLIEVCEVTHQQIVAFLANNSESRFCDDNK